MNALTHIDSTGRKIKVGDIVRWHDSEGEVLILEYSGRIESQPTGVPLVYASNMGYWGGCGLARADEVEVIDPVGVGAIKARLAQVEREYSALIPGVSDDSVLEAERDTLAWVLSQLTEEVTA